MGYGYGDKKATFEEFLKLQQESEERYEYIDGEIYLLASPRTAHQIAKRKDMIKKLDLYLSCGVKEYWIVNPDNKEVTVYLFEDHNISKHATYKADEAAQSFIYEGLSAEIKRIFRF